MASCGKNAHFETPVDLMNAYTTPVKDGASEVPFSYKLEDSSNGTYCTTGYHEFTSLEETCKALLNDQLNNSCARDQRVNLYYNHDCQA